jgi:hypothetical protein
MNKEKKFIIGNFIIYYNYIWQVAQEELEVYSLISII